MPKLKLPKQIFVRWVADSATPFLEIFETVTDAATTEEATIGTYELVETQKVKLIPSTQRVSRRTFRKNKK